MGQCITRLRTAALFILIVTGSPSLAAAGQAGGQNMSKTPEQVRRELVALMDALPSLQKCFSTYGTAVPRR